MLALALQVAHEGGGPVEEIARTFGVDWVHLGAQIISFGIVCAVLYAFAYKPILRMLDARRQQISSGLANAEKIKKQLERIEVERQEVLQKAGVDLTKRETVQAVVDQMDQLVTQMEAEAAKISG